MAPDRISRENAVEKKTAEIAIAGNQIVGTIYGFQVSGSANTRSKGPPVTNQDAVAYSISQTAFGTQHADLSCTDSTDSFPTQEWPFHFWAATFLLVRRTRSRSDSNAR